MGTEPRNIEPSINRAWVGTSRAAPAQLRMPSFPPLLLATYSCMVEGVGERLSTSRLPRLFVLSRNQATGSKRLGMLVGLSSRPPELLRRIPIGIALAIDRASSSARVRRGAWLV